ncbi:hypothetical protein AN630_03735 [Limosilactobacillus fermentum]|nr:hypothetical protein AN630_03735 [Limosilactobacillus fermentum]
MKQPRVCIFSSCLVDLMFPNVGQSMVEVLERLGCETFLPEQQVCCGQPTYNSGYSKGSMKTFKNPKCQFKLERK